MMMKQSSQETDPHGTTLSRVLRFPDVKKVTGLSRTTIWRRIRDGEFPKSVKLGARGGSVGWLEDEVLHWQKTLCRSTPLQGGKA